ncbi:hypothetical protein C7S18_01140 [Ahniella affigens]|uniref:Haem-binding uptake Tiki superfamily ChaN domain-containing protein n=1 Tax=Ahniella affigens TaxID=2021234 RepID=A0A2P1PM34_9GAMM|nr:hypothetical protein [Ahniella affigens]AVP95887.1 hypothetical protein C7S18_01140 [Ahniella affigens]
MLKPLLFALLSVVLLPAAADDTPSLRDYLKQHQATIAMDQGQLSGPGAAPLLAAARAAPFILIGEDHGFADVPQFVVALDRSLGTDATDGLVLEIGPLAADRLRMAHQAGDLTQVARRFPGSAAFVEWRDDAAMVAHWLDAGKVIAGVDQEFILSMPANLAQLRPLVPVSQRSVIDQAIKAQSELETKMRATGDVSLAGLLHLQDADVAAWRHAVASAPSAKATRIIDALADSAHIYDWNSSDPARSNRERARLMKREFMAAYRQGDATAQNRWMFRMGAYHVGRGLSPTGQYDLGNLASELAESRGQTSLHLLVLPLSGQVNRRLPVMADTTLEAVPYDGRAELASVTGEPFLDAIKDQQGWAIYDLRPLRAMRTLREQGGSSFAQMVYAFDFAVMIDVAKPARAP